MIETRELDAGAAAAVLDLAEAVAAADGVSALSEQTLLDVRTPVRPVHHLLVPGASGVVGYAQVGDADGPASAELAVRPDHRRAGVGRALLDAVRAHAPGVAVWAHGNLPAARALAGSAGMDVVRELLQMAVPLDRATAPASARTDVDITTFEIGSDEEAWVRLNARAFADHPEQGRMSVADLRARAAEDWFDPTMLWLARPAGEPTADPLASMWVKVEPGADDGEIYALGVDPDAQGRGLGATLTALALAEMARRGLRRATLYVEGDNTAALRTYERAGFGRITTDVQYR